MQFLKEFFEFLRVRKKYWLFPVILVILLMAGLVFMSTGTVVAPFIYTLF